MKSYIWTNEGKILFKSDSNAKLLLLIFLIILIQPVDGKGWVMSFLELCFICWGHYESILFILSIFIFFVLCLLWFYGNTPLNYCFEFLYKKNTCFSLYYLFVKKNIFNSDKSKLFLINNIPIVLLVINHIEILLLNNHLFKNRDIIIIFDIT